MPSRLGTVTVATSRTTLQLPWESRQALLDYIRPVKHMAPAVEAFEAVGASRPVGIPPDMKGPLVELLDGLMQEVTVEGFPPGVAELRDALHDDLHDKHANETGA